MTKTSRIWQLGAVVALAVAVVVIAVVASSGGTTAKEGGSAASVSSAPAAIFVGLEEHDGVLGDPAAKRTLTEFVDLQCPVCKESAAQTLPTLVENYVRTGKVKLDASVLQFVGPDSVTAARWAAAAREQGKLWPFVATFYAAQGQENSGFVTPSFLRSVAKAAGLDVDAAKTQADSTAAATALNTANDDAAALGVNATPTFVLQRGDGAKRVLETAQLEAELAK